MDCATCARFNGDLGRALRAYAKAVHVLSSFATSGDLHELIYLRAKAQQAEEHFEHLTELFRRHQVEEHAPGERVMAAET